MNSGNISKAFRRAGHQLQKAFPVILTIVGVEINAHRWALRTGSTTELAGLLPDFDVTYFIALSELSKLPDGFAFQAHRTTLAEGAQSYRVENITNANGDPRLAVHCKTV